MIAQIPAGHVTTYGDLAEALGDRAAARWVAEWIKVQDAGGGLPTHRVLLKSGATSGTDPAATSMQLERLEREGVRSVDGSVDLCQFGIREFRSAAPLAALRELQERLASRYEPLGLRESPERIAAVDAAYPSDGLGAAALAVCRTDTGMLVDSAVVRRPVRFPYITGYLAFREIEILRDAIEEARAKWELPSIVLVDGNGRLHPRRAGIATQLGVLMGLTTIGVGKKLICGSVDLEGIAAGEARPIVHEGETLGAAVVSTDRSRPVFVSPGHRIDLDGAVRVVQSLFRGHRLPEPLFHADRLSKEAARS